MLNYTVMSARDLIIEGARQNNLQNITLSLPQDRVIVITGVSGSGKSSLAFDTIFAEGQWRFIESLSTYARLFLEKIDRPDVDSIRNIRPAIALEQRNSTRGARSTVGTDTELYDYFRLLYAALARPKCPSCNKELLKWTPSAAVAHLIESRSGSRALISFESDADRIEMLRRQGFLRFRQNHKEIDGDPLPGPIEVIVDRLVINSENRSRLADSFETAWKQGGEMVLIDMLHEGVEKISSRFICSDCGIEIPEPQPLLFSYNHPIGACPSCNGFGNILSYDPDRVVPDKTLSLARGAIEPWAKPSHHDWYRQFLDQASRAGIDINIPFGQLPAKQKSLIFDGAPDVYSIGDFFKELESRRYKLHIRVFLSRYRRAFPCPDCRGARLRPESLSYRLAGQSIADIADMPLDRLDQWQASLKLSEYQRELAGEALHLVQSKLRFLRRVGLDYLTMSRQTRTLSGGEAQRINLSNQLSARLTGTLYVLDEPTVGLHARDTERILSILKDLSRMGNSVIVVEHDRTIIESADWVVEMGPGGGHYGGKALYNGSSSGFLDTDSLTAKYLTGKEAIPTPLSWRRRKTVKWLTLEGASENNLKNITLSVPLQTFTCITGVSGSGKSTLVTDTLYPAVSRTLKADFGSANSTDVLFKGKVLKGVKNLKGVKLIDQTPIGRSPRSNPATYLNVFSYIRKEFAAQPEARRLGFSAGNFSFNVPGGRCEECKGEGSQKLEMYFFEDLYVMCDECKGRRYRHDILYITYLGKDIHQVLEMTIDDAIDLFCAVPAITKRLTPLAEIGLGYLKLGQPAPTLSGGEAQRLKICAELGTTTGRGGILYILDEPTTGLHFHDIKKFLAILNRLVDDGNTVLVVEHNLDMIKCADWVVDLGPEGGEDGGFIVAEGQPDEIAYVDASHTGRALRSMIVGHEGMKVPLFKKK